jgi:hypothetical protein
MGSGPFSSESRTSEKTQTISGPQTATEGGLNLATQGGKGQLVNLGGLTISKVGKGATVTITSPPDLAGLNAASAAFERAMKAQADTTAAALGSIGNLAETRISDGANISADVSKTGFGVVAILGIAAAAVFLFVYLLKGRKG